MTLPASYEVRDGCGNCAFRGRPKILGFGSDNSTACQHKANTDRIRRERGGKVLDLPSYPRIEYTGHCEYHEREKE